MTVKKTQPWDKHVARNQGRAWTGQQKPLLLLTQAVPQKQPISMTEATQQLTHHQQTQRGDTGPVWTAEQFHNKAATA